MRLGGLERAWHSGLQWPVCFRHVSVEALAEAAGLEMPEAIALFDLHVEPAFAGPSSIGAFTAWAEVNPALAQRVLEAVLEAHQLPARDRLFLRVLAFHGPRDGVWQLRSRRPELGGDRERPMAEPFATRWDVHGPEDFYRDQFVECLADGRGVGAYVHPRLFTVIAPKLRSVLAYHSYVRPTGPLTWQEFLGFSAYDAEAHRVLREAVARSPRRKPERTS